jgi:hypothetical protein
MDKKIIGDRMQVTDPYAFSTIGTLEDLVDDIRRWSEQIGLDLKDIDYELDAWDGVSDVLLTYTRPLTEKELEREKARKAKLAARRKADKEKKEAAERKEYERLKKKFG